MKNLTTCPSAFRLIAAAIALAALAAPAQSGERGHEVEPEFNAYIKLTDRARVYLLADLTVAKPADATDAELGVHVDFTLAPLLRPLLRDADWARERYLWMRLGYRLMGSPDHGGTGPGERRGIAEITARMDLPQAVWLVHRARLDLRDIQGEWSTRFRYRLGVEREFNVGGVVLVPYAQAEIFHDSRYDVWNRQLYQVGVEVELNKQWRIETYVARQNDSQSASSNLDRIGIVLKHYR